MASPPVSAAGALGSGAIARGAPVVVSTRPVVSNFQDAFGVPDCQATDPILNRFLPAHVVLSPMTAQGQPTMGFVWALQLPVYGIFYPPPGTWPTIGAGPFDVTVYMRSQAFGGQWTTLAACTGVNKREWWVCNDVDACELFFRFVGGVTQQGYIALDVVEI